MPLNHLGPGQALCGGLDQFELNQNGLSHSLVGQEPLCRGAEDTVKVAEGLNERPGEGFDVFPGDGPKEDQLQQFIIWQGPGAAHHKPFA